jgi:hypothetical protein
MPLDNFINDVPLFGEADGFDGEGRDAEGYDRDGFRFDEDLREEVDREGFNRSGFREDRHGRLRDREGYDEDGYDEDGFNENGYNQDGYDENGYNDEGYDENGYNEDGYDEWGDGRGVASGFFNGDPDKYVFYSTAEEKQEADAAGTRVPGKRLPGVPYYGMEIELTSDCTEGEKEIIQEQNGNIVWAKEDCSVEGFEMVSHPMTARWAADNFPWRIVEDLGMHGAEVMEESNGLHIHVSRSGFNGWHHLFSWLKFLYRNSDRVKDIGGRSAGEWGAFHSSDRGNQFTWLQHNMKNKNQNRSLWDGCGDRVEFPRRYIAVNLQNRSTVEVRVFASTTSGRILRQRFELIAGSVEYTRNLSIKDIRDGGWEWNAFTSWLVKNGQAYPAISRRVIPATTLA